jgi:predicted dehydrogenase
MSKIRVAVIGAGGIGSTHLRAYAACGEQCEIVGLADIDIQNAQKKAAEYGCQAFQDYEQMLDETRPQAISICTPPNLHLPIVQSIAARNLSVLCEKPPARTVAETEAIVQAMASSKGILQFAFCHRFHQSVLQAREMIASGRLGKVVQVYNRFGFRFDRAGRSWFTDREVAGGGVLIDTLVHSVDIFRFILGEEVSRVSASVSTALPVQVEDSASILVTSTGGTAGSLNCSWVTPVSEAEFRIYGTEGEAIIDYAQSGGLRYRLAGEPEWTQQPFNQPDRFVLQAEHFLKCVADGQSSSVGGSEGLAVMKVIEAAYQSLPNGASIKL